MFIVETRPRRFRRFLNKNRPSKFPMFIVETRPRRLLKFWDGITAMAAAKMLKEIIAKMLDI